MLAGSRGLTASDVSLCGAVPSHETGTLASVDDVAQIGPEGLVYADSPTVPAPPSSAAGGAPSTTFQVVRTSPDWLPASAKAAAPPPATSEAASSRASGVFRRMASLPVSRRRSRGAAG